MEKKHSCNLLRTALIQAIEGHVCTTVMALSCLSFPYNRMACVHDVFIISTISCVFIIQLCIIQLHSMHLAHLSMHHTTVFCLLDKWYICAGYKSITWLLCFIQLSIVQLFMVSLCTAYHGTGTHSHDIHICIYRTTGYLLRLLVLLLLLLLVLLLLRQLQQLLLLRLLLPPNFTFTVSCCSSPVENATIAE